MHEIQYFALMGDRKEEKVDFGKNDAFLFFLLTLFGMAAQREGARGGPSFPSSGANFSKKQKKTIGEREKEVPSLFEKRRQKNSFCIDQRGGEERN